VFPDDVVISPEAQDLIKRWLCEPEHRLGANGIEEIKAHPFFHGIDWNNLRTSVSIAATSLLFAPAPRWFHSHLSFFLSFFFLFLLETSLCPKTWLHH